MKRSVLTTVFFLWIFCFCDISYAGTVTPYADSIAISEMKARLMEIKKTRPTVALVLSGGGAKGAAHVSVISYLEKLNIPVDVVLGTSIGGLVGGLYSVGYTPEQLDTLVRNMDWDWALTDRLSKKYRSYSARRYKDKFTVAIPFMTEITDNQTPGARATAKASQKSKRFKLNASDDAGLAGLKANFMKSLPSGYIAGQNVSNLINSLIVGYQDSLDFKDLPIPFFCIATDMVSGKAKFWHDGKLSDAMRSTMSIPGIFAPVKIDGMVLVDGGMRDNYPTALAREMGADIIIGVELSDTPRGYDDINNIADIIAQGISMLGNDKFQQNADLADITIKPDLSGYSMMSFSKDEVDSIMVRGHEAAVKNDSLLREVARLTSVWPMQHDSEKIQKSLTSDIEFSALKISDVEFVGISEKDKQVLLKKLKLNYSNGLTKAELDDMVSRIYGTGAFKSVVYEILGKEAPYRLVINCEKGPIHRMGLGLRLDTEEVVAVLLNVGFNANKLSGNTYDITAKISANPYIRFDWSYDAPKFPTINANASFRWTDLNAMNLGENRLNLNYLCSEQEFFISNNNWSTLDLKGGIRNEYFSIKNVLYDSELSYNFDNLKNDYMSLFVDARWINYEDVYFPDRGLNIGASYSWTLPGFMKSTPSFHTVELDGKAILPIGKVFAFIPSFHFRMLFGDSIPVAYMNIMGGYMPGRYADQHLPFVGINNISAMKDILSIYRVDFRFRVAKNHYLKAIVNCSIDCNHLSEYAKGRAYYGAALQYSFNTIFGPLSANIQWSDINMASPTKGVGFYLSAGFDF